MALLCVPLVASSVEKMLLDADRAKASGADVVELRLDCLKNFQPRQDLGVLLREKKLPTIVTYRPKWDGGRTEIDEQKRLDALRLAVELGSDYVDVELKVADEFIKSISEKRPEMLKVIVSSCNYENTPSVEILTSLAAKIRSAGADIVKIATTAKDITDVSRVFQVCTSCKVPIIGLVMGDRGVISRLFASKFGGYLTYAALDGGIESAVGEPTIKKMLDVYNFRRVGRDTQIFGLIGNPVYHSKSPFVYNKAFSFLGLNAVFVHFLVDDLPSFLNVYSSPDFAGFSCTIPHKEIMCRSCDEVDPIAKAMGAVNTTIRRDGKLIGCNTDYIGAISAIEEALRAANIQGNIPGGSPVAGKLLVIMGAGGTGKALSYIAKEKGARVVIANRTYERAEKLAQAIGGQAIPLSELEDFHPEEEMILANTTSVGMYPNTGVSPIPKHALKHYILVFDAIYTPRDTQLLIDAKEAGAIIADGVEMFLRQAKGQIELYTNRSPAPMHIMEEAVLSKD
ncbi:bifunctional 3-dehydroquinate dehydratase/shikimate dehydrogenase, chloroplastic-like [Nymphaea colorata]|nr:bifunctional 3-dehydroquinate dehydratase/shikimate dehydrogenase, chloroplastic-like [Nymphaea colorata]